MFTAGLLASIYSQGKALTISDLPIGTVIALQENEWLKKYSIIAKNHSGYPSNSVTLILGADQISWASGSWNTWKTLPTTVYNGFDAAFKPYILPTTVTYVNWNDLVIKTETFNVFPPDTGECGAGGYGVVIPYLQVASNRVYKSNYWLRSGKDGSTAYYINTSGAVGSIYGVSQTGFAYRYMLNVSASLKINPIPNADGSYNPIF